MGHISLEIAFGFSVRRIIGKMKANTLCGRKLRALARIATEPALQILSRGARGAFNDMKIMQHCANRRAQHKPRVRQVL